MDDSEVMTIDSCLVTEISRACRVDKRVKFKYY